jgi:hypothetical protein
MRKRSDRRDLIDADEHVFQGILITGTASFDLIAECAQNMIDPIETVIRGSANVGR